MTAKTVLVNASARSLMSHGDFQGCFIKRTESYSALMGCKVRVLNIFLQVKCMHGGTFLVSFYS